MATDTDTFELYSLSLKQIAEGRAVAMAALVLAKRTIDDGEVIFNNHVNAGKGVTNKHD